MNKKKGIGIALAFGAIACAVLFFHTCFQKDSHQPVKKATDRVRIGVVHDPIAALMILAQELRYFEAEGLDAAYKEYPSGKSALDSILAGEVDVAPVGEIPIALHSFHNEGIRILAMVGSSDNDMRIVARKDSGITRPVDLKGKRIGVPPFSTAHFFSHLFLLRHTLSERDVTFSFMSPGALVSALQKRQIDAFSMREPYVTRAQEFLGQPLVVFAEPYLYTRIHSVVSTDDFTEKNPEAVVKILRALIRAERFAEEHPDRALQIAAQRLRVSERTMEQLWPLIEFKVTIDQPLLFSLQDAARWALDNGLVKGNPGAPNYLRFIYTDGLHAVNPNEVMLTQ